MDNFNEELMKHLHFISQASNTFMRKNNQKFTGQQRVLAILGIEDGLNQSYLAKILDLRPSSLAELLKKMENNGDIVRKEDTNDKRIKHVYLTEQGTMKAQDNLKNKDIPENNFFAGLSLEEQQQFDKYLSKIADGWSADFKKMAEHFVDPTDRLKYMQDLRDSYFEKLTDAQTDADLKNIHKQMRRDMHHHMHHANFDPRNDFFRNGFWGRRPFKEDND